MSSIWQASGFKGKEAFERSLESPHSGKVKESIWQTQDTDVKLLTPGIAIVHVHFSSHGDRNPDGSLMPPRRGIFTRVEVKRDGHWLIVASQATNIVPPLTAATESLPRYLANDLAAGCTSVGR
jgi:uncharacterized protein (TIGR02246 family)